MTSARSSIVRTAATRTAACASVLAGAAAGLVVATGPASAATEHCPNYTSPTKVELSGDQTSVTLKPYSTVCYKAGTQVKTVTLKADGVLTSTIYNRAGAAMGISYYIVTGSQPPRS